MTLEERIGQDLKTAMKAKDQAALRSIRAVKAALLLAKTDGTNSEMTEEREIKLLQKLVKQRQDSLEIYKTQNRDDLAQVEQEEIEVISRYLPEPISQEELESKIQDIVDKVGATGMKDMGKVMGIASKELAGAADGKTISAAVRKILAS